MTTPEKLGFEEEEKGQLREWMTVAREMNQHGGDTGPPKSKSQHRC
jgi:hypothetical protein